MSYIEYDSIKRKKSYQPKEITAEQALVRLTKLCSVREKSVGEVREWLVKYGVDADKHSDIVRYLIDNRYVDDRRFASAYVRDKTNFSAWGVSKIKNGLRAKGISCDIIDEVMEGLDKDAMRDKIEKSLNQKMHNLKYRDKYDLRNKMMRFAFSRGYDMEQVSDYLRKIINDLEEE